jgi:UDP-2,3-diacylglucosamine pyrophosphatase LpxH
MVPRRYRAIFVSDLHLGHFGCRADHLLAFFRSHHADAYYLVGDILDLWLFRAPVWSNDQDAIVEHLRERHAAGAKIIYVRGNHDRWPETAPPEAQLPAIAVESAVHQAMDGRNYWIVHGDGQHKSLLNTNSLSIAGHHISEALASVENGFRRVLRRKSRKRNVATSRLVAGLYHLMHPRYSYQSDLALEAERLGFDGVICGHFHQPDLIHFGSVLYANCGDWIHSFTALAECHAGSFHLLEKRHGYSPQTNGKSSVIEGRS